MREAVPYLLLALALWASFASGCVDGHYRFTTTTSFGSGEIVAPRIQLHGFFSIQCRDDINHLEASSITVKCLHNDASAHCVKIMKDLKGSFGISFRSNADGSLVALNSSHDLHNMKEVFLQNMLSYLNNHLSDEQEYHVDETDWRFDTHYDAHYVREHSDNSTLSWILHKSAGYKMSLTPQAAEVDSQAKMQMNKHVAYRELSVQMRVDRENKQYRFVDAVERVSTVVPAASNPQKEEVFVTESHTVIELANGHESTVFLEQEASIAATRRHHHHHHHHRHHHRRHYAPPIQKDELQPRVLAEMLPDEQELSRYIERTPEILKTLNDISKATSFGLEALDKLQLEVEEFLAATDPAARISPLDCSRAVVEFQSAVGLPVKQCSSEALKLKNCLPFSPGWLGLFHFGPATSRVHTSVNLMHMAKTVRDHMMAMAQLGNKVRQARKGAASGDAALTGWNHFKKEFIMPSVALAEIVLVALRGEAALNIPSFESDNELIKQIWETKPYDVVGCSSTEAITALRGIAKRLGEPVQQIQRRFRRLREYMSPAGLFPAIEGITRPLTKNSVRRHSYDLSLSTVHSQALAAACHDSTKCWNSQQLSTHLSQVFFSTLAKPDQLKQHVRRLVRALGTLMYTYRKSFGDADWVQFDLDSSLVTQVMPGGVDRSATGHVDMTFDVRARSRFFSLSLLKLAWRPRLHHDSYSYTDPVLNIMGKDNDQPLSAGSSNWAEALGSRLLPVLHDNFQMGVNLGRKIGKSLYRGLVLSNSALGEFLAPPKVYTGSPASTMRFRSRSKRHHRAHHAMSARRRERLAVRHFARVFNKQGLPRSFLQSDLSHHTGSFLSVVATLQKFFSTVAHVGAGPSALRSIASADQQNLAAYLNVYTSTMAPVVDASTSATIFLQDLAARLRSVDAPMKTIQSEREQFAAWVRSVVALTPAQIEAYNRAVDKVVGTSGDGAHRFPLGTWAAMVAPLQAAAEATLRTAAHVEDCVTRLVPSFAKQASLVITATTAVAADCRSASRDVTALAPLVAALATAFQGTKLHVENLKQFVAQAPVYAASLHAFGAAVECVGSSTQPLSSWFESAMSEVGHPNAPIWKAAPPTIQDSCNSAIQSVVSTLAPSAKTDKIGKMIAAPQLLSATVSAAQFMHGVGLAISRLQAEVLAPLRDMSVSAREDPNADQKFRNWERLVKELFAGVSHKGATVVVDLSRAGTPARKLARYVNMICTLADELNASMSSFMQDRATFLEKFKRSVVNKATSVATEGAKAGMWETFKYMISHPSTSAAGAEAAAKQGLAAVHEFAKQQGIDLPQLVQSDANERMKNMVCYHGRRLSRYYTDNLFETSRSMATIFITIPAGPVPITVQLGLGLNIGIAYELGVCDFAAPNNGSATAQQTFAPELSMSVRGSVGAIVGLPYVGLSANVEASVVGVRLPILITFNLPRLPPPDSASWALARRTSIQLRPFLTALDGKVSIQAQLGPVTAPFATYSWSSPVQVPIPDANLCVETAEAVESQGICPPGSSSVDAPLPGDETPVEVDPVQQRPATTSTCYPCVFSVAQGWVCPTPKARLDAIAPLPNVNVNEWLTSGMRSLLLGGHGIVPEFSDPSASILQTIEMLAVCHEGIDTEDLVTNFHKSANPAEAPALTQTPGRLYHGNMAVRMATGTSLELMFRVVRSVESGSWRTFVGASSEEAKASMQRVFADHARSTSGGVAIKLFNRECGTYRTTNKIFCLQRPVNPSNLMSPEPRHELNAAVSGAFALARVPPPPANEELPLLNRGAFTTTGSCYLCNPLGGDPTRLLCGSNGRRHAVVKSMPSVDALLSRAWSDKRSIALADGQTREVQLIELFAAVADVRVMICHEELSATEYRGYLSVRGPLAAGVENLKPHLQSFPNGMMFRVAAAREGAAAPSSVTLVRRQPQDPAAQAVGLLVESYDGLDVSAYRNAHTTCRPQYLLSTRERARWAARQEVPSTGNSRTTGRCYVCEAGLSCANTENAAATRLSSLSLEGDASTVTARLNAALRAAWAKRMAAAVPSATTTSWPHLHAEVAAGACNEMIEEVPDTPRRPSFTATTGEGGQVVVEAVDGADRPRTEWTVAALREVHNSFVSSLLLEKRTPPLEILDLDPPHEVLRKVTAWLSSPDWPLEAVSSPAFRSMFGLKPLPATLHYYATLCYSWKAVVGCSDFRVRLQDLLDPAVDPQRVVVHALPGSQTEALASKVHLLGASRQHQAGDWANYVWSRFLAAEMLARSDRGVPECPRTPWNDRTDPTWCNVGEG